MWILDRVFKRKQASKATISFIGPSMAGKTTLIRFLETGKPVTEEIYTTLGMNIRTEPVKIGGWEISVIDTGGQKIYQQLFWELAINHADALIFIVDATIRPDTNPQEFNMVKDQIHYALDIISEEQPVLFLLNKQDLTDKNPISSDEFFQLFGDLIRLVDHFEVRPISAKYGDGVIEAIEWLVHQLEGL